MRSTFRSRIRSALAIGVALGVVALTRAANDPVAARSENSLGMRFAVVPGTKVAFSIWETRVRDFAVFADATGHAAAGNVYSLDAADGQWKVHPTNTWRAPGFAQTPEHPVVNVSWEDAVAFCRWLTARERAAGRISARQEYRLPTDAEWSAAVGPTTFPWGEQWPPPAGAGNFYGQEQPSPKRAQVPAYDDGAVFTREVGGYAPNAFGLHDLAGNAAEWCLDFYRKEMNSPEVRKETPSLDLDQGGAALHVLRGTGWAEGERNRLATARRSFGRPVNRYCVTFRVVLTLE